MTLRGTARLACRPAFCRALLVLVCLGPAACRPATLAATPARPSITAAPTDTAPAVSLTPPPTLTPLAPFPGPLPTATPPPTATPSPTNTAVPPTPTPPPTATPSATPPPGRMLDDFDYPDLAALHAAYWINAPGNELGLSLAILPHVAPDAQALGLHYQINGAPPVDYAGIEHDQAPPLDWRGFGRLCIWIQNDGFPGDLVLQFREQNGEVWKAAIPLQIVSAGEQCVPLTAGAFVLAAHSAVQNERLDLAAVDNYAVYMQNGGTGRGILYLDALQLRP